MFTNLQFSLFTNRQCHLKSLLDRNMLVGLAFHRQPQTAMERRLNLEMRTRIDICDNCLKKAVRLRDVGVQCVKVEFDEGKWYE